MKHATPQHQRAGAKPAARRPGPAPMRKAAMGRPYGLNHVAIGPMEIGPEAQAHHAANRVVRGERGVAHDLTPSPAASVAVPSRGQPLPSIHRAWLEPAFGADLGAVRVHHDAEAATAARAEHAHAFTAGRDIYFGQDRYDPHVQDGRHLLAHEVAHVLQQTAVAGPAQRLRATEASGAGEVQRARAPHPGEDAPALAGVFHPATGAPAPHDAPVAGQPMPGAMHPASAPAPRPAMSPAAKLKPAPPRETDPSKIRPGRRP
jgi:Domain of unknown function (DUF4157)